MMIRFFALFAVGLFLAGCNKGEQTGGANQTDANAPRPISDLGILKTNPQPSSPSAEASSGQTNAMIMTASGLRYQVLKRGTGTVSPRPTDIVKVHYTGTLLDGTVFDSSVERGQPAVF